jgi:exosome complex exonuclease RRP6
MMDSKDRNYRKCFIPILRSKPFALEPLEKSIASGHNVYTSEILQSLKQNKERIKMMHSLQVVAPYKDVNDTPLVYVDDLKAFEAMLREIEKETEVAIDLEHNDFRSYRGITCLMQLSTRKKDYIVDPFPLFDHIESLNLITANPNIRKVFHAGELDILWLQRDFGVYVVNMFDTSQAAQVIGLEGGHGLANLVKFFCGVSTNKEYQMADWRKRPLSAGMLQYARTDTHFLLYIRDRLEEMILTQGSPGIVTVWGRNMLVSVYEKSAGVSMKTYEDVPPDYEDGAFKKFLQKLPGHKAGAAKSNPKVRAALQGILKWRDELARKLDESKHYVLSNADCLKIANALPFKSDQILRLVGKSGNGPFAGRRLKPEDAESIIAYINNELFSN